MTGHVLYLESILPRRRDVEPRGKFVDSRFSPSYPDLGLLRMRAQQAALPWKRKPLTKEFYAALRRVVYEHVRHVTCVSSSPDGEITFETQDEWGKYRYSFWVPLPK